jgi:hypothetical protein
MVVLYPHLADLPWLVELVELEEVLMKLDVVMEAQREALPLSFLKVPASILKILVHWEVGEAAQLDWA